jgi:hypothetical protein
MAVKSRGLWGHVNRYSDKYWAVAIFLLLFTLYLSNCFYYMSSTDTIPAILLPFNILDKGTVTLDNFMPC